LDEIWARRRASPRSCCALGRHLGEAAFLQALPGHDFCSGQIILCLDKLTLEKQPALGRFSDAKTWVSFTSSSA